MCIPFSLRITHTLTTPVYPLEKKMCSSTKKIEAVSYVNYVRVIVCVYTMFHIVLSTLVCLQIAIHALCVLFYTVDNVYS